MPDKVMQLKDRVLNKTGLKTKQTPLTWLFDLARGFNCLGEILGRTLEVRDPKGNLVYTITQKPIKLKQLNCLLKEYAVLKQIDAEIENKKWGSSKTPQKRLGR